MNRKRKNHGDVILVVQHANIHIIPRYHYKVNSLIEPILATMGEKEVITPTALG